PGGPAGRLGARGVARRQGAGPPRGHRPGHLSGHLPGARRGGVGARMRDHPVGEGECFSSIAYESGFFWKALWEQDGNAALRDRRQSPVTLVPGEDTVKIPDLRLKEEACPTEKVHTFRRRGVPAKLKVRLLHHDGTPRKNEEYFLE